MDSAHIFIYIVAHSWWIGKHNSFLDEFYIQSCLQFQSVWSPCLQELERQLAAKEATLPREPASDDVNAVTLLVRMPDGSRHGRRFLKTDKLQVRLLQRKFFTPLSFSIPCSTIFWFILQSLFNFIDIGRKVKPGSYRMVSNFITYCGQVLVVPKRFL